MPQTRTRTRNGLPSPELLRAILDEIRLLRQDLSTLLPADDLGDYVHADRVRRSYRKAIKRYPPMPVAVWK